eukprot:CAMPEP_0185845218 /NCGR_PEP_ID=MMETSP1354-20130828/1240_1 /TAXON_ID=708628 /ORGANISM="Erythrolobus madagascarensis, Strain CCMP3276" /LENGTH=57 /DNA_ID=CAMNT_0028545123 /DNA_START=25 /DNA_END=198 /DNA_ORIENTATION=-
MSLGVYMHVACRFCVLFVLPGLFIADGWIRADGGYARPLPDSNSLTLENAIQQDASQ